nr:MAG TPA: hypothetical protein [Caudoviricetes sp.]
MDIVANGYGMCQTMKMISRLRKCRITGLQAVRRFIRGKI